MANRFEETRENERDFERGRERGRDERTAVSRDFMTNEPRYRGYGEMSESWNEPPRQGRMGREDISERNLDRGDWYRGQERWDVGRSGFEGRGEYGRGGTFGERAGAYGSQDYRTGARTPGQGSWQEFSNRDREEYGRTRFDESIAGQPASFYRSTFYGRPEGGQELWNREIRGRDFGRENMGERSGWSQYGSAYGAGAGQYAGRGPKGYKRPDDRIHEDVCEVLTRHPGIDASEVDVRVNNGEVTLTGSVEDRQQKRLAEDAIENLPGVRDVNNQVRVKRGLMERVFGTGEEERKEEATTRKGTRRAA
jgi:osmotically-inducible protein OsmY